MMVPIGRDHLCTYLLLLSFMAGAVGGNSVDLTTTPGAYGKEVVEAVVGRIRSNCILSDDKLFLRRLAYVESLDGTEPKTYRPGYHGGIWQVDESMLKATLPCHVVIQEECQIIQSAFGIDWQKVTWSDLRKPLYSGLAAALYVLQRNFFNETVPGTLEEQAAFWSHFYHLGSPDSNYTQVAAVLNGGICKAKMDLAFLLDSSGSIDFSDYLRMLNFTRDLVNALDIGPDATQVGTVVYGSDTNVAFHLDDHTDKASLQLALSFLTKDDGGTFTSGALDQARNEIFSPLHGARSDAKKVAMLLTDGASNSFYRTVKAAQLLRDEGVTIFAIGVGNPNVVELHAVASEPNCTHVVLLQSFLDINSILYSMSRDTCNAPKTINFPPIVPPSNGTFIPTVHEVTITERINTSTTLKVGSAGNGTDANSTDSGKKTLVATTECGIVEIYTSYSTPKPSSAFYEQKAIATPGREAILHFQKDVQGRPLYISVVGSNLPETGVAAATDCRYNVTISKQTPVEVVCREGDQERPCTSIDLASVCKGSGWTSTRTCATRVPTSP